VLISIICCLKSFFLCASYEPESVNTNFCIYFSFFHLVILGKKSFGQPDKLGQPGGQFSGWGPEGFFDELKIVFIPSTFGCGQWPRQVIRVL